MTTPSSKSSTPPVRYITYDEFERFEAGITRWQEDTRHEQREFQNEMRTSMRNIAHEVREARDRPTNWGWVLTGVGTAATIAALIGGMAYTAITNSQRADTRRIDRLEDVTMTMAATVGDIKASRWSAEDHRDYERARKQEMDRRFAKIAEDIDQLREAVSSHQADGHPATVLRELQNVRQIAERADTRSEGNALKIVSSDKSNP